MVGLMICHFQDTVASILPLLPLSLFWSFALLLLLSCFSRVQLCDPIDGSPPGSSVPGILQARILEWVAISFSNACMHAKSLQSCPTLCNPHGQQPTRLLCPQDSLGKSTAVGCHFFLKDHLLWGSQLASPEQPSGEAHKLRGWGLLPTANEDLRKLHQQPVSGLPRTRTLSWGFRWSQCRRASRLPFHESPCTRNTQLTFPPISWPSETVR